MKKYSKGEQIKGLLKDRICGFGKLPDFMKKYSIFLIWAKIDVLSWRIFWHFYDAQKSYGT